MKGEERVRRVAFRLSSCFSSFSLCPFRAVSSEHLPRYPYRSFARALVSVTQSAPSERSSSLPCALY